MEPARDSVNGHGAKHDDLLTPDDARHAVQQGHRLYAVSPSTGVEVEVAFHGEGIRTGPGESADLGLDDLPTCS